MSPYYTDEAVTLWHGDCLDVLAALPGASVDAVVTDPPYGLEFMGKEWDAPWKASSVGRGVRVAAERGAEMTPTGRGHDTSAGPYLAARVDSVRVAGAPFQAWCGLWAAECLRVLKPGGHMLAFGGTRTWHRLACAVEDAGFEIRDSIAWLYGSGFPKSLNASKAIDKAAGVSGERGPMKRGGERLARLEGGKRDGGGTWGDEVGRDPFTYIPGSDAARQWQGWGTALKPAFEPIVVARKPLTGTVASNVMAYGTGALNIDACRVGTTGGGGNGLGSHYDRLGNTEPRVRHGDDLVGSVGRWPANVVLDDVQAAELDQQSGNRRSAGEYVKGSRGFDPDTGKRGDAPFGVDGLTSATYSDSGGASRFFPVFRYEPKAPTTERPRSDDGTAHPTVKPLDLIRWLVRLVTPPGGTVLDPFLGSGTTAEACIVEGFRCIGVERDEGYLRLAAARLAKPIAPVLFGEGTA